MYPPQLDVKKLQDAYKNASIRQFYLDYDGTLTPIVKKPEDATPSEELLKLLSKLSEDQKNSIYIISGRDRKFLKEELGSLQIGLSAEHGAFLRPTDHAKVDEWEDIIKSKKIDLKWKEEILAAFKGFVDKVPNAFIEAKEYAITLHYRQSDKETVKPNKAALQTVIDELSAKYDTLDVRKGKKSLEARVKGITKGYIIKEIISNQENKKADADFVMCIGDDVTDEDMFVQLAKEKQLKNVFSCTVGRKQKTSSNGYFEKQGDVLTALSALCEVPS
jgi:trehalose 6-phosphate synthase/phosphatase